MYFVFFVLCVLCFFFFKQKTAYEMRISDWSSDVCSSDLLLILGADVGPQGPGPLVSSLTGKQIGRLRVPLVIVPGNLSDEELESLEIGSASCRERVCQYV